MFHTTMSEQKVEFEELQEQQCPSPLQLRRTDSVSSCATSHDFQDDRQVWCLADEDTTLRVYQFCVSHNVPSNYEGPILVDDEIFIIENVHQ